MFDRVHLLDLRKSLLVLRTVPARPLFQRGVAFCVRNLLNFGKCVQEVYKTDCAHSNVMRKSIDWNRVRSSMACDHANCEFFVLPFGECLE